MHHSPNTIPHPPHIPAKRCRFISAVGTPLADDESLHVVGLEAHLADQWNAGIDGLLVAGTMGQMQLLADRTYQQLVERSIEFSVGRGEVMVGVGDASFARTRDRIEWVDRHAVDAVVVLTPFLFAFSQDELVDYYWALADVAKHPVYLYNLPSLTRSQLDIATVERVAKHPNIAGIKCSVDLDFAKTLLERIGNQFRVIVAQPFDIDTLARQGIAEHLDGIFTVAPAWTVAIGRAADASDWPQAAKWQRQISELLRLVCGGGLAVYTALLNARGIPGNYAPRPYRPLSEPQLAALLNEPVVRHLLNSTEARDEANVQPSTISDFA